MQYGDTAAKIERTFSFNPPDEEQAKRYAKLRAMAKDFGHMIDALCPAGREKSLSITKLEESVMWAIKSISLE